MGSSELNTVARSERGKPARPYDAPEASSKVGAATTASMLIMAAVLFAKQMLWPRAQAQAEAIDADQDGSQPSASHAASDAMLPADGQQDAARHVAALAAPPAVRQAAVEPGVDIDRPEDAQPAAVRGSSGMSHVPAMRNIDAAPAPGNDNRAISFRDHGASSGAAPAPLIPDFNDSTILHFPPVSDGPNAPSGDPAPDSTPPKSDPGSTSDGAPATRDNRAPVLSGSVVLSDGLVSTAILIAATDFLQHAADPDGDALHIEDLTASSGQLTLQPNGIWLFNPAPGDETSVTFHYLVSDGQAHVDQTAVLDLRPVQDSSPAGTLDPNLGTAGDDVLTGTLLGDTIDAGGGRDIVHADAGDDTIYGGDGDDILHGGGGDDIIMAGAGDDTVFGESGDDIIFGDDGADLVFAGAGNDVVHGGAGYDTIYGGAGDDILHGGAGNDRLVGDEGRDLIDGGDGDDIVVATAGDGDDVIRGGAGADTYDLSATTKGVIVDLAAGRSSGIETGDDQIDGIENVIGGSGDDILVSNDQRNEFTGGGGDDVFVITGASASADPARWDQIKDFSVGDRIDVSAPFGDGGQFTSPVEFEGEYQSDAEPQTRAGKVQFAFAQLADGEHTFLLGWNYDASETVLQVDLLGHHALTQADVIVAH